MFFTPNPSLLLSEVPQGILKLKQSLNEMHPSTCVLAP